MLVLLKTKQKSVCVSMHMHGTGDQTNALMLIQFGMYDMPI